MLVYRQVRLCPGMACIIRSRAMIALDERLLEQFQAAFIERSKEDDPVRPAQTGPDASEATKIFGCILT
jgi:hypothetical protein